MLSTYHMALLSLGVRGNIAGRDVAAGDWQEFLEGLKCRGAKYKKCCGVASGSVH